MKLLIILSLGLLSFGAMAQPHSRGETEHSRKIMRENAKRQQERADYKKAHSFKLEKVARLNNGGHAKLKISGDGYNVKTSVLITTYGSASIKSNIRTQRTNLYTKKFRASNLEQVKNKLANGIQLELDALFTDGTAELSAESNSDVVDFHGAGQSISFDL